MLETARTIRETPPARLQIDDRQLASGSQAIAATCLAKRPAARYGDAAALAADVEALLAGRPLVARQPWWWESLVIWLGRNRALAASGLAAAVSAAAAAGLVGQPSARQPTVPPPAARTAGTGPMASFPNISSRRTTPLRWLSLSFDRPVRSLAAADFRLMRNGQLVPLTGLTVSGERTQWELRGLEQFTADEGRYVLELVGTPTTPVDLNGRRLAAPARAVWQMPPYAEISFGLLDDDWQQYLVSLVGAERCTEQAAGATTFFRPTALGEEGTIVMRFPAPFPIQAATLTAPIAVWTTGDPFPYDPDAKAALDVSSDGDRWTTLDTRQANRGGFGGETFDIREQVAGSREVWVRARLTATREWPEDGPIFAQFLRTTPNKPGRPFRLTLTGGADQQQPVPAGIIPADN